MIVNMLNTLDRGGAATAARRLHDALLAAGVDSRFWCADLTPDLADDPSYRVLRFPCSARTRLGREIQRAQNKHRRWFLRRQRERALRFRPPGFDIFSPEQAEHPTQFPAAERGDILHLHWVARFLDSDSFFASIPDEFPILWTLHDMQPLTGGCHYASGCEAYTTACRQCPQLGARRRNDLASQSFRRKQTALRGKNLHVVSPSRWLEREARRSAVLADVRSFHTIPYGLDTDVFSPGDKNLLRRALRIADDCLVIGFGAEYLHSRRKGTRELLDAMGLLETKTPIVGLACGGGHVPASHRPQLKIHQVGLINDPALQAAMYSAMDFFVLPSLEDNSPLMGLEAMACGTPVVAFETGGIPDYVRPHETGLLARVGDVSHLAGQIDWLAEHPQERARMGLNARTMIVREFAADLQARRYLELYTSLMAERDAGRSRAAA